MQKRKESKRLVTQGLIILGLIAAVNLLLVFADHPQAVEKYYSEGFYQFVCYVLHPIFNLLPFSVGDVIYVFAIGYIIYAIIRVIALCIKKQFLQASTFTTGVIIMIMAEILTFYLFWGLNYFRPS